MWGLNKPDIKETVSDIREFERLNIVGSIDGKELETLTNLYDSQRGFVSVPQHNAVSNKGAKSLRTHYSDTYSSKPLFYIRETLFGKIPQERIYKCPYCHIGTPAELDHYMDKSHYPALSLCRLNLIPTCGTCNRTKRDNQSNLYVHPYYSSLPPNVAFLSCDINILSNSIAIEISLNEIVLKNLGLFDQFKSHWNNLKLGKRLQREAISFLQSEVYPLVQDEEDLYAYVEEQTKRRNRTFTDDWRTVVLDTLCQKLQGDDKEAYAKVILRKDKKGTCVSQS